jgi:parvulin-like peptidyl-prolyl isomerase
MAVTVVLCRFLHASLIVGQDAAPRIVVAGPETAAEEAARAEAVEADEQSRRAGLDLFDVIEPTQQELLAHYERHKDDVYRAAVKWQEIVVACRPGESREAAEQRARDVLAQLKDGADFADLARRHSFGATRDQGGFWDWCDRGSPACAEYDEFLFAGKVGSTSEVRPVGDEFHIVRILDRREAGRRSFEQMRPVIVETLKSACRVEFSDGLVVATVNSVPLTVGDVIAPQRKEVNQQLRPYRVTAEIQSEIRQFWVKRLLSQAIDRKLRALAFTADLDAGQHEHFETYLAKAWNEYAADLRQKYGVATMSEFADKLREEGSDLAELKRTWRDAVIAHQFKLLRGHSMYAPTRDEMRDYYQKHKEGWAYPCSAEAEQIVVRCRLQEPRQEAEARARELLARFNAGDDFTELARTESDGLPEQPLKFPRRVRAVGAEANRFMRTAGVGAVSEVIPVEDGFRIIRITSRGGPGHLDFEVVQQEIQDRMRAAERNRLFGEVMRKVRETAEIRTLFDDWKFEPPEPVNSR